MDIDDDVVVHVARLARVRLDEEERARLKGELAQMLAHFEELKAIDTEGVEPTFHTVASTPLRPDEPRREVDADALHEDAPQWVDGAFAVPKVLEG